ncbi:hypothetical protein KP78_37400 [Jeotgalibacillus soli]|uniref:Nucleotidyltransferase n=1 Tax=Jeotgalibacillus soli TaxID=889306 RepID=A0A0C2VHE3_9BACL|nr:hypothetical protein KP78_37400 [Jeotgalibacillus soli]
MRMLPQEVAEKFIEENFLECDGAAFAGNAVRGEETATSGLDIVVFDASIPSSFWEFFYENGWSMEVFAYNLSSCEDFFESDCERGIPSMPRMVAEGLNIKDKGILKTFKKEANELLKKGPDKWSEETIRTKRYFITDALDDFIGCTNRGEEIFAANTLAQLVYEFILRTNECWTGSSKWVVRSFNQYDTELANEFVEAFDFFTIKV